jgi:hypothetical protein
MSNRRAGRIVAAALLCAVIGLSAGCAASTTSASSPSSASAPAGHPGTGGAAGGGFNARSGPAEGGAAGTVASVSATGFTLSTSTGRQVTVEEVAATNYQQGTNPTSASAVAAGQNVLVLGMANGTTITASKVLVQPSGSAGSATTSAAGVVQFQPGAPAVSKQVGQIPANYTEGAGTIVGGTAADQATQAALTAYPGGIVDRVVQVSSGEYEVHNIGVRWPHHIFVDRDFKVVGAD